MEKNIIYKPREDSFLLQKYVKKFAKGIVLDVGTGSGIQALTAAQKKSVKKVIAVDIQHSVIQFCNKKIKSKKIFFNQSDLFDIFKKSNNAKVKNLKYDTIIFNPPYLPSDIKLKDLTVDGGKGGYEVIERFLSGVNNFLKPNGIILLLFSSLTNRDKVNDVLRKNLLEYSLPETQKIFFEELYVYLIKKSNLLKKIEKNNIKNIKYFTKGHRGVVFSGNYKNKKAIIKIKNQESAVDNIENEAKWLKILNRHKIGPKLIFSTKDYIIVDFVEGDFIFDYIKKSNKKDAIKTLKKIFFRMYLLDKLNVNKEEMHHPYKHIIISENKPIMVDFERCHNTKNPKNVTQFCQFLMSSRFSNLLKNKKIRIDKNNLIGLAKVYKNNINFHNLNRIVCCLNEN